MTLGDRTAAPTPESPLTRVDIGEVKLATRVLEGGAGVMLFIHGSFDDHHTWLPLTRALAVTGHTMVVYDRRGHSASTEVAGQGTIRQDADDAARLIEQLGLGRVHVVGHSYGAGVAVLLVLCQQTFVGVASTAWGVVGGGIGVCPNHCGFVV